MDVLIDWISVMPNPPLVRTDFVTHWAEAWSTAHFLDHGHLWGYDPTFLVGYPGNALYDIDNKLVAVATWLLSQIGIPLELSYNLVMTPLLVGAPVLVYPAVRWFGLPKLDAFAAQIAGLALWYFDPLANWFWEGGPLVFLATVYIALLVLAAAIRLVDAGSPTSVGAWIVWFVVGPLLFWLHAMSFILLLIPLATLVVQRWRGLDHRKRAVIAIWPPLVVLINLPWIIPFHRFVSLRTASNLHLQGGLSALGSDLLNIGGEGSVGEDGTGLDILAVRWIVLITGLVGLWMLLRSNRVLLPVIAGVVGGLILAYGAVHIPGGGDFQPYRYVVQSAVWSSVGVAAGFHQIRKLALRADGSNVRTLLIRLASAAAISIRIIWTLNVVMIYRPGALGGTAHPR